MKLSLITVMALVMMLVFGAVSKTIADSGPNMKEGRWEITTTIEIPGMPMAMPPTVTTQCLSKEEIVPNGETQQNPDCQPIQVKTKGDTVSWSIKCDTQDGPMNGIGHVSYSGSSFKGEMKIDQGGMAITNKMSGKYLGECD